MLRFKLERTRKYILDANRATNTKQVAKEIQTVVDLFKRIEADPYFEELHRPFWKKYGKP